MDHVVRLIEQFGLVAVFLNVLLDEGGLAASGISAPGGGGRAGRARRTQHRVDHRRRRRRILRRRQ